MKKIEIFSCLFACIVMCAYYNNNIHREKYYKHVGSETSQEGVNGNNSLPQMFICFHAMENRTIFSTLYEIDLLHLPTRNIRMPFSSTWTNMTWVKKLIQFNFSFILFQIIWVIQVHLLAFCTISNIYIGFYWELNDYWCHIVMQFEGY